MGAGDRRLLGGVASGRATDIDGRPLIVHAEPVG
jgi:hypothetical protein